MQIHHIQTLCLALNGKHTVISKLSLTRLTTFGRNQNHTIGTLRTLNGGCRSIFQNFHTDDISRVDGGKRRNGGNRAITQCIAQTIR